MPRSPKRSFKIPKNARDYLPLLLVFVLFPTAGTTLRLDLIRFSTRLLRGHNEFHAAEIFQPRGGEGILPGEVRRLVATLREADVRECSIAPTLQLPSEAYQRLLEGAY